MARPPRWALTTSFLVVVGLSLSIAADVPDAQAPTMSTSAQFLKRPIERLTGYRAWRRLEGENTRFNKKAWMEVMTELHADGRFEWRELGRGGSEWVLEKALEPVIKTESEASPKSRAASELNTDNYMFTDAPAETDGRPRVRLEPKRKEKYLVDGWLIVSPTDADLVEIRGRLAKSPSFWVPTVRFERHYQRIMGVRVPVLVTSEADVRLAGRFSFKMTFRYEQIDGRPVTADSK
jgi:hypothetical protein